MFSLLVQWENVWTQWSPCQITNITWAFPPGAWPSLVMLQFVYVWISFWALSARPHCPVPPGGTAPSLVPSPPCSSSTYFASLLEYVWFPLKQIVFFKHKSSYTLNAQSLRSWEQGIAFIHILTEFFFCGNIYYGVEFQTCLHTLCRNHCKERLRDQWSLITQPLLLQ